MVIQHTEEVRMNYYQDYISLDFQNYILKKGNPVEDIDGLTEIGDRGGLETVESFKFLIELYNLLNNDLNKVLQTRINDREFIDLRTKALCKKNTDENISINDNNYETVIGLQDSNGRIVIGPLNENYGKAQGEKIAPMPEYLKGVHVTLFGPPGDAKLSINAMNAIHRKLKKEPAIVDELLSSQEIVPMWGADDEDSKTPLRSDLIIAGENLAKCFDGTLEFTDPITGKEYKMNPNKRAIPIKRIPGLALPCSFLFYKNIPMPLHLYDFALHLFKNWHNPKSLTFYIPKLENEEEAAYIHKMISCSENMIKKIHPKYILGTVRVLIVLENPRAVFRVNEIMDELYPYFVGASLGWHDYLGSTARLFKEDSNYRIPVKADPNIVIKHIKGSHELLAAVVGKRGGIKIGGMYGVLPISSDIKSNSFQISIRGFIKDVVTQLKRDLNGFWVAHPDFVRLGLALVEAWKQYSDGQEENLYRFINELIDEKYQNELISFIKGKDIQGLDYADPLYKRSLIVADIKESSYISNNSPKEIAYNVFQSLQYLTDWLSGNGCVALPAQIEDESVRMMDDLATAERSRWEVWHEITHNRFSLKDFLEIAHQEYNFIRKDLSNDQKIVQVKWNEQTEKWYPVAFNIMIKLMTEKNPPEFATEYLIPFTNSCIREELKPWERICKLDSSKYPLDLYITKFNYYFDLCGASEFADFMANNSIEDKNLARQNIMNFDFESILSAASFHGDIGESKKSLDEKAMNEQTNILNEENETLLNNLCELCDQYKKKFKMKFLISAKGFTTKEIYNSVKERLENSNEEELNNAKTALWEITEKRLVNSPYSSVKNEIDALKKKFKIVGSTIAISSGLDHIQSYNLGKNKIDGENISDKTWFEFASLSKSVATAFSIEFLKKHNLSLNSKVNLVLEKYKSDFRITTDMSLCKQDYSEQLEIHHLMSHNALNMHYVNGVPLNTQEGMPNIEEFLNGNKQYRYEPVKIINKPGTTFKYSGAGFIVLQYLIELIGKDSIENLTEDFIKSLDMDQFSFNPNNLQNKLYAHGYDKNGNEIINSRKMFPSFAAGSMGNAISMNRFLSHLSKAFHDIQGSSLITHNTAIKMLDGQDIGSKDFMNCNMGLGIFTANAGDNKLAIHQGANDGFRSVFIYCYDGLDLGKGFTIQTSGDENAMLFNAYLSQLLLKNLNLKGLDWSHVSKEFNYKDIPQEEIVNFGYKELVFNSFLNELPEKIINSKEISDLLVKNKLVDSEIIKVSNEKFARAENLFSKFSPVFDPTLFGKQGKIMDSWETVRHNPKLYDYVIFKAKESFAPNYCYISTKYHNGNQVEYLRVLASNDGESWQEIISKRKIDGHSFLYINLKDKLDAPQNIFNFFKLEIYPDGGLTRFALFEECPCEKTNFDSKSIKFNEEIPQTLKPLHLPFSLDDLDIELISASDEHYAPATQVLSPYPPISMFDGFESARSRIKGHFEEILLRFKSERLISQIKIDFKYFVNNNPKEMKILGLNSKTDTWMELLPQTYTKSYAGNLLLYNLDKNTSNISFKDIKIFVYPDGGFNRISLV